MMIPLLGVLLIIASTDAEIMSESPKMTNAPIPAPTTTPSTCYQCYIIREEDKITIYKNNTEKLNEAGTVVVTSQGDSVLEHCHVASCTGSCVLATNTAPAELPRGQRFPTETPWYATSATAPLEPLPTMDLEYRLCVPDSYDVCSSFLELNSMGCKEEKCKGNLCNKAFSSNRTKWIIVGVVVTLVLLIIICSGVAYWYFKLRKPQVYKEVGDDEEQPTHKRPRSRKSFFLKVGFVQQRVSQIEDDETGANTEPPKSKGKPKKSEKVEPVANTSTEPPKSKGKSKKSEKVEPAANTSTEPPKSKGKSKKSEKVEPVANTEPPKSKGKPKKSEKVEPVANTEPPKSKGKPKKSEKVEPGTNTSTEPPKSKGKPKISEKVEPGTNTSTKPPKSKGKPKKSEKVELSMI